MIDTKLRGAILGWNQSCPFTIVMPAAMIGRARRAAKMIADGFDFRTLIRMDKALERVCRGRPGGESHELRKLVAESILLSARGGRTAFGQLTEAGERALTGVWRVTRHV